MQGGCCSGRCVELLKKGTSKKKRKNLCDAQTLETIIFGAFWLSSFSALIKVFTF
jgi:predicted nucleic acid-binding Zn ribbon protein